MQARLFVRDSERDVPWHSFPGVCPSAVMCFGDTSSHINPDLSWSRFPYFNPNPETDTSAPPPHTPVLTSVSLFDSISFPLPFQSICQNPVSLTWDPPKNEGQVPHSPTLALSRPFICPLLRRGFVRWTQSLVPSLRGGASAMKTKQNYLKYTHTLSLSLKLAHAQIII